MVFSVELLCICVIFTSKAVKKVHFLEHSSSVVCSREQLVLHVQILLKLVAERSRQKSTGVAGAFLFDA